MKIPQGKWVEDRRPRGPLDYDMTLYWYVINNTQVGEVWLYEDRPEWKVQAWIFSTDPDSTYFDTEPEAKQWVETKWIELWNELTKNIEP